MKRAWILAVWMIGLWAGCKCGTQPTVPAAQDAAATSASGSVSVVDAGPAAPRRKTQPAPKPQEVKLAASDGVKLEGALYTSGASRAPLVVLAHRLAGNRSEWTPLVERLFPAKHPVDVLAFDLRGHGSSLVEAKNKGPKGAKKIAWNEFTPQDFAAVSKDIEAALQWADHRPGGSPSAFVLVGSDLGATAVTIAAKGFGSRLRGVALISPGAALRGLDIYKPFGAVLALPNLILGAQNDNISQEPMQALGAMSQSSKVVRLAGTLHTAENLGREQPALWDDLADWVEERVAPEGSPEGSATPAVPSSGAPPGSSGARP